MSKCTLTPGCLLRAGHAERCAVLDPAFAQELRGALAATEELAEQISGWAKIEIGGKPLWRHTSGAQVYQSSFWMKAEEERKAGLSRAESSYHYINEEGLVVEPTEPMPTWKAQRAGSDVANGDDDGYIYPTREEAMKAALAGRKRSRSHV